MRNIVTQVVLDVGLRASRTLTSRPIRAHWSGGRRAHLPLAQPQLFCFTRVGMLPICFVFVLDYILFVAHLTFAPTIPRAKY